MANEITLRFHMAHTKTGAGSESWTPAQQTVTLTGANYVKRTQEVGTSAEAIAQGEIGTPGYMLVRNLDDTNFVEIGYDDSGFKPTVKLLAGEYALFRHTQATPQAKADTAAVDIEYYLLEA